MNSATPSAARVAGGRLNPQLVERALAQNPPVGHAVERDAAGQAEFLHPRLGVDVPGHPQHDLLGDGLDRGGEVHVALGQQRLGLARRTAEEPVELLRGHRQSLAVIEVRHVHAERAVVLQVDQLFEDQVDVPRLAVRGQAHQLVFARVDLEAAVVGEGRVEHARRVRKVELVREVDAVARAAAVAGRGPFADAVDGEDRRLFEGRGEESAGRVRFVVLGEDEPLAVGVPQAAANLPRQVAAFSSARAAWPSGTTESRPARRRDTSPAAARTSTAACRRSRRNRVPPAAGRLLAGSSRRRAGESRRRASCG